MLFTYLRPKEYVILQQTLLFPTSKLSAMDQVQYLHIAHTMALMTSGIASKEQADVAYTALCMDNTKMQWHLCVCKG